MPGLSDRWIRELLDAGVYPLSSRGLPYLAGLSGLVLIVELVTTHVLGGLPALLVWLLVIFMVWLALYRLASEMLLSAADGDDGTFELRSMAAPDDLARAHIVLWLLLTVAVLLLWLVTRSPVVLAISLTLVALGLPAATVILTLTRSLMEACNPVRWWQFVRRMGDDYGLAVVAMVLVAFAYGAAVLLTDAMALPRPLAVTVRFAVWAWGIWAWFRLLGVLTGRHREELGEGDGEPEPVAELPRVETDAHALAARLARDGGTVAEHDALDRQLRAAGDDSARLAHARDYVALLLYSYDRPERALELAADSLSADPRFCLDRPGHMRDLVQLAAERGERALVFRLVGAFLHHFSGHPLQIRVELTGCTVLAGDPGRVVETRRWIERIRRLELDEAQRAELDALRARVDGA